MAAKMGVKAHFSPVQSGSGDPSPSNVRPISGWTGCEVTRCGKNLFDKDHAMILNAYLSTTKIESSSLSRCVYVRVKPNSRYIISKVLSQRFGIALSKETVPTIGSAISSYDSYNAYTFGIRSTNADTWWIIIWLYASNVDTLTLTEILSTVQVEEVASDEANPTAYEPYSGSSYPVTFPSEAGTLYGGYVDYERGEVVAEWGYIASYNGETIPGEWMSDRDVYAAGTSPTTGAEVVYKLAAPITYPLTPTLIKSLKGANTIWSDMNGNLEISYWKL